MMLVAAEGVTHRTLTTVDLGVIAIYFVIIFSIGFYFARKERTSEDYFLASRDVVWFAIGASLFVSNISTEHFIGLAGSGATSGLAVGHFEWLACLILLILGWVFVPFYLRSNVFTMPEFLERRFNRHCSTYLASISILAYIFTKISVHLYAAAVVLERVVGWSPLTAAVIRKNLPQGYEEAFNWGMITYQVPLKRLRNTYNGQPLCYAALASQKNHMSVYLMCMYGDKKINQWFREKFKAAGKKLDMGKSCVRFHKLEDLPLNVIGEAIARVPMENYIRHYEASRKK